MGLRPEEARWRRTAGAPAWNAATPGEAREKGEGERGAPGKWGRLATRRPADESGVHKRVAAKVYALFDREWPGLGGRGGM